MVEWTNALEFLIAAILLTLMPGPDNLYVTMLSMTQGVKAGLATSIGLCLGVTVHTFAAALGIAAIIHQSAWLFQSLKILGALYLFYLAWQSFKERNQSIELSSEKESHQGYASLFRKGILMNVLNPKVSLFFLALLPQFVSPQAGHVTEQMIGLGLIFMLQAIVIFALIAYFAGVIGKKFLKNEKVWRIVNWTKTVFLAVLGVRLAIGD